MSDVAANSLAQINTMLQFRLLDSVKSDNVMINTLMQIGVMSFSTYINLFLQSTLNRLSVTIHFILRLFRKLLLHLYKKIRKEKVLIKKDVTIAYITDTRQINELFKAVHYYLQKNMEIDFSKESSLNYIYTNKIDGNCKNISILREVGQKGVNKIRFKGFEIFYSNSTDVVTLYMDREKKKENFKIVLWVNVDEGCKVDVLDEFCQLCVSKYSESLYGGVWKQQLFTHGTSGKWTGQDSNNARKFETVVLKNDLREEIRSDFELFLRSEEWYVERDINYTRTYLFYGKPGCGKTSMIKALSLYAKRHIHYLSLKDIKNDVELNELFKSIDFKKTVIVIEDIDASCNIVKSRKLRENEKKEEVMEIVEAISELRNVIDGDRRGLKDKEKEIGGGISLSGLLNVMDGLLNCHGRIVIITTNHLEVLDEALIREGRCDVKYEFESCDRRQIIDLYRMFYEIKDVDVGEFDFVEDLTPAYVSNVFMKYRNNPRLALKNLNKK